MEAVHFSNEGWMASLQSLLITVSIAIFVIGFIVQAFQIPSESMQNTLLIGDYLLVDKAHFGPAGAWSWLIPYQKVRRGDIVVFRYPVDPKQHFVKRVIGTPGDRIRLVNKRVYVNGLLQREPFAEHTDPNFRNFRDNFPNGDPNMEHLPGAWQQQMRRLTEDGQLIVPDGYFFVMGDNRDDSSDSRYWGFVPRQNIIGRPLVIYWSIRNREADDPDGQKSQSSDKLTRFALALKKEWQDLRWRRMLTLVR
jgi:signal peptidase I